MFQNFREEKEGGGLKFFHSKLDNKLHLPSRIISISELTLMRFGLSENVTLVKSSRT